MFRPKYYCFVFIALLFLSCAKETIPDNPVEVIPPLDEEEKVESNILSLSFPITYSKSTLENDINLAVDLDHNFTIEDVSSFKITSKLGIMKILFKRLQVLCFYQGRLSQKESSFCSTAQSIQTMTPLLTEELELMNIHWDPFMQHQVTLL